MNYVVALTGGIASGKSTVGKLFVTHGACLIDADQIARQAVAAGSQGLQQVVRTFGSQVLLNNGELNRAMVRKMVFSDPAKRRQLESIVHPLVGTEIATQIASATEPYCIVDVPLLVETGQSDKYHRVLVVDVSSATQFARLKQRDGIPDDEIRAIIAAQASRTERLAAADDVIDNNGTLEALADQVCACHEKYQLESIKLNKTP